MLRDWCAALPEEWGFTEENAVNDIGGAALPMGFNRTPVYADGLLLVGDAGGMVNPFNGEGIAYAMQSAALAAATVVQALARPEGPARERALQGYPAAVRAELASYYRLGNRFAHALRHPWLVRTTARYGLPRRRADGLPAQAAREPARRPRRRRLRPAARGAAPAHPGALRGPAVDVEAAPAREADRRGGGTRHEQPVRGP